MEIFVHLFHINEMKDGTCSQVDFKHDISILQFEKDEISQASFGVEKETVGFACLELQGNIINRTFDDVVFVDCSFDVRISIRTVAS